MILHFRTIGEGEPLIIMHGVFGSADNWQSVGKEFAKYYKVYLVDMRNHGKSPHSEEFSYEVMAEDIRQLMKNEGLQEAHILGHSMGGKVAMTLATNHPTLIKKLVVVDIAPKQYPPHHAQIFKGFRSVNLDSISTRKEAEDQMSTVISSLGVRQFILKNLDRDSEGRFRWKLNLDVIESAANKIGAAIKEASTFEGEALFIAGANSDYILDADHDQITTVFPKARIEKIEGAGHWVHAEKPRELRDLVIEFLA